MPLIENVGSLSYWHRTIENSIVPEDPLRGDHKCQIAIIGAGYSGLWTAYYLKQIEPDLDIAIIEAEFAGRGAAGRNGGWCSMNLPGFEELAKNPKTSSQAKEILPHLFQMVDEVGDVAAREGIDCDYHKGGVVHVAVTDSQERSARRLHETFAALGAGEAQAWLEKSVMDQKVRMENGRGGTYSPHCAVIHPAKLALGLANHLKKIGVCFYEQSPVTSLSQGKAATALGSMTADKIVVATEGYTHSEPGLPKNRFLPVHAFMTVTEPLSDDVFNEIGINNREAFADLRALVTYGQRTVDNRLAFGYGARTYLNGKPRDTFSQDDELFGIIQQILEKLFPVLKGVKYEQNWGGAMGMSRDQRAFVQYDRNSGTGWLGGFLGNGVGSTNLAGRTMAELVLDQTTGRTGLSLLVSTDANPLTNYRGWEWSPLTWSGSQALFTKMRVQDKLDSGI